MYFIPGLPNMVLTILPIVKMVSIMDNATLFNNNAAQKEKSLQDLTVQNTYLVKKKFIQVSFEEGRLLNTEKA